MLSLIYKAVLKIKPQVMEKLWLPKEEAVLETCSHELSLNQSLTINHQAVPGTVMKRHCIKNKLWRGKTERKGWKSQFPEGRSFGA